MVEWSLLLKCRESGAWNKILNKIAIFTVSEERISRSSKVSMAVDWCLLLAHGCPIDCPYYIMLQSVIYWQIKRELDVRYVRECSYIVYQAVGVNSLLEKCGTIFCQLSYFLTNSRSKYLEKDLFHSGSVWAELQECYYGAWLYWYPSRGS